MGVVTTLCKEKVLSDSGEMLLFRVFPFIWLDKSSWLAVQTLCSGALGSGVPDCGWLSFSIWEGPQVHLRAAGSPVAWPHLSSSCFQDFSLKGLLQHQ